MTFKMNLVSLPIICLYTYQFNYLTLLTNIIFVPFFTYFILPVTLISALSVKWSFWQLINSFYAELYKNLDAIANNLDFIFITGSLPIWSVIILSIIGIFYVESRGFANKFLGQYLIIFVSCIVFNKFPLFGSVNLIDVGQGDSIMVTTPLNRQTFLIDVAGKLSYPTKPWAKRTVHDQVDNSTLPFLKSQGISHIDKIFLSHKDVDHVGNLETILTKFKVKEVNFGIGLENNPRIKSAIKQHPQVKFKNLRQEDAFQTGPIKWQVLWPQKFSIGENGDSLTLLAQIKQKKWLFPGDLDMAGEKAIVKDHQFKVDYLKVGHHGSRTATSEKLLDIIQPKFGFISAGINNRYGHPNKETLERLQRHGVRYLNTADYGMISWYYYFFNDEEKITTFLKGDLLENNGIKK
jgi:Predicted hydrolase (metallo-beta-lactamase superfamily)